MNTLNADLMPLNALLDRIFSINLLETTATKQRAGEIKKLLGDIDSQLIHLSTIGNELKVQHGPDERARTILRASNKRTRLCLEALRVQFEILTQQSMSFDEQYSENVMTLRQRVRKLRQTLCRIISQGGQ
ncbi:hypothetical protein [Vibrio sp. WXL210]|uniref:hypothetical protein n=1 Tax=Vibrio sp. WXL210 TaxID=3450709 RepID=UPI003EC4DA2F